MDTAPPPLEYLSTARAAARLGRTPRDLAALARAGALPGAIRVGGPGTPWAIPLETVALLEALDAPTPDDLAELNAETPHDPRTAGGAAPDTGSRPHRGDPTPGPPPLATSARAVVEALAAVPNARPARALADLTWSLLALDLEPEARADLATAVHRAALILEGVTP